MLALVIAALLVVYLILCFMGVVPVSKTAKELDLPKVLFTGLLALISFGFKKLNDPSKTNLNYLELLLNYVNEAKPEDADAVEEKIIGVLITKI